MSLEWTFFFESFSAVFEGSTSPGRSTGGGEAGEGGGGESRGKDVICRHPRVQLVTSCVCAGDGGRVRSFTLGQRPYLHFSYP